MSQNNFKTRVLFATLRPTARLAQAYGVSLKDMKHLLELAYYQQSRASGLKMREMSEQMDIGMSKVGLLSKQLKEHFVEPEEGLHRQIIALLWAQPLSLSKLAQALGIAASKLETSLETLIEEGRIRRIEGRTDVFELTGSRQSMDIHAWLARVDGLNTLFDNVTRAIRARFDDNDERAMVRNLAFRVRKQDLQKLNDFYQEQLLPLILELDRAVEREKDSTPMTMTVLWAPDEDEE